VCLSNLNFKTLLVQWLSHLDLHLHVVVLLVFVGSQAGPRVLQAHNTVTVTSEVARLPSCRGYHTGIIMPLAVGIDRGRVNPT
jgi:hypothetical protein